ncbi:hypothetical protein DFQ29_010112 [Apophysomyces sp. BC1021]|nr:hypothetical protein DFQ29_010112 [Apophysomyces sp. BC1021]
MPPKKTTKAHVSENEPLSKAQEEEMSSALIAKLLAEDAANGNDDYYAEYSNDAKAYDPYHGADERDDSYEEESEDDYAPKRNGKGRGRGRPPKSTKNDSTSGRRGRKRKMVPAEENTQNTSNTTVPEKNNDNATLVSTPVKPNEPKPLSKKPRKPVPEGYNTGNYSEEEERRFLEGLEQFGRDWTKLQAHIATRDANSIRSHAQKHLIKLFRDSIPLPEKVRETGEGYTLSGKPLDPNSAAAKPYLMRMGMCTETPKTAPTEKSVETSTTDPVEEKLKGSDPHNIQKKEKEEQVISSLPVVDSSVPDKIVQQNAQPQSSPKM